MCLLALASMVSTFWSMVVSMVVNHIASGCQGLGAMELDNLRDWEAKFNFKYPIVGSIVKK